MPAARVASLDIAVGVELVEPFFFERLLAT
jgi:hypothetical protein